MGQWNLHGRPAPGRRGGAAVVGLVGTQEIKTFPDSTGGWVEAASNALIAPAGATNAQIQKVVSSLSGRVYVDDFIFGK